MILLPNVCAMQLDLEMFFKNFFVESLGSTPGTLPNLKSVFSHRQATHDASHYYASYDLLKVV